VETQLKISTTINALCESRKCGASLEINEKERENIESCRKKKYVSFGTDQLLEGYNDMKKGYKGTKKL
jgi:hypothetical protein